MITGYDPKNTTAVHLIWTWMIFLNVKFFLETMDVEPCCGHPACYHYAVKKQA